MKQIVCIQHYFSVGALKCEGESLGRQVLERQVRELVYKVFGYLKREGHAVCICVRMRASALPAFLRVSSLCLRWVSLLNGKLNAHVSRSACCKKSCTCF